MIYDLYSAYRGRCSAGVCERDLGQVVPGTVAQYSCTTGNPYTGYGSSFRAACEDWARKWEQGFGPGLVVRIGDSQGPAFPPEDPTGQQFYTYTRINGGAESGGSGATSSRLGTGSSCPVVTGLSGTVGGGPAGPDGRCPTGTYTAQSQAQNAAFVEGTGDRARAADYARAAAQAGQEVTALGGPIGLTGPSQSVAPPRVTTITNPDGSTGTTTQQRQANIVYEGDSYTYNVTNQTSTTNNGGTTTTTTTDAPEVEVCGLPGKPACKIDETGTPSFTPPTDPGRVAELSALDPSKRAEVADSIVAPTFGFIGAPPIAACTPFEMPNDIPPIDPCGVVEGVRGVMAYLWGLAAAWLALGMIRKTVTGGA